MVLPSLSHMNGLVQAILAASVGPLPQAEQDAIERLEDVPEPMFPNNRGDTARHCVLNDSMRCAPCLCLCVVATKGYDHKTAMHTSSEVVFTPIQAIYILNYLPQCA